MATAVQKITLSSSHDIPFNKLVLSQSNVRRVKAGVSIEDLAASIARRGLIQSLSVFTVVDAEGRETGMFEVPAGRRRFRALEMLVKQKRLAKVAPVPCVVRERNDAILPEEVSLAENIERAPLHPLDQFRAFQDMRAKGMTEEEIAAAFLVQVTVVKQRLRLASVSPALLDVYAEDGMTLEQLMAFTVTQDHARQEQVWDAIKDAWSKEPYQIRRMLTETTVRASDKRAVFVGVDAYEEAGGIVMRDLFQSDDGGWLQDAALLDRLVAEKLKATAEGIAAEGWKWVEVAVSFPYDATRGLRELQGEPLDLTTGEKATIDALNAEYQKLEAEYEGADELPDEVDQRLGEIETALASFDECPARYEPGTSPAPVCSSASPMTAASTSTTAMSAPRTEPRSRPRGTMGSMPAVRPAIGPSRPSSGPSSRSVASQPNRRRMKTMQARPGPRGGVRRRSPPACRSPSRPQWCGLGYGKRRLQWRPSAPSRRPARTSSPAKSSPSVSRPRTCASSPTRAPPARTPPATGSWSAAPRSAPPGPSAPTRAATIWASSSTIRASTPRSTPISSTTRTARASC
jgi:ParB/RepB/Spo0J family partition protein